MIAVGCDGNGDTVVDTVCTVDDPQLLFALTVMFPPEDPANAIIVLVDEVPDQPFGNVQVYDDAPLTGGTLYSFELLAHTEDFPVMFDGWEIVVAIVTVRVWVDELPQLLFAKTVMLPPVTLVIAVIEFVVEVPVHPEGRFHVYEEAPVIGAIVYVTGLLLHTEEFPVMAPGCPMVPEVFTLNVRAKEDPQLLFAVTEMVPALAPAVALIVFVVELPDHPTGNVQV